MSPVTLDLVPAIGHPSEGEMGKKKPTGPTKASKGVGAAKPSSSAKGRGRSREVGDTVTFTFEMTPDLSEDLDRCADAEDRTKKAIITRALEAYLTAAGQRRRLDSPGQSP